MASIFIVLALVLAYFLVAFLAVTPQTHALRIALWPVIALLASRVAVSVDMSLTDRDKRYANTLIVFSVISIATRTLDWTLPKAPLVRRPGPGKESQSSIMNALDLALTLRGHDWEWSRGVRIPRETRPTDRRGFTLHVLCSALLHGFFCGVLHAAVGSFSPTTIATTGASIFDETLPSALCYLRAGVIALFATTATCAFIQFCYDVCTLVGVLFLGHAPEQWPPAFDAPWRATSVSEFWARRWHQFFRRLFLVQGGFPLQFLFGRAGFVIGTFLSSGLLHHLAMAILDGEVAAWRVFVGFVVFAPVALAEDAFKQLTGRRVGGVIGWVWTTAWLVVGGSLIMDGFARAGMLGRLWFMEWMVPRKDVVVRLVVQFDAWLHGAV